MKKTHVVSAIALCLSAFAPAFGASAPLPGNQSVHFRIDHQTEIPGDTLKPGSYTISVVDHLQDRAVVRIAGPNAKSPLFLGLPNSGLTSSGSGPIAWDHDVEGKAALRGFSFPDGSTLEFVYPKTEAVAIAKANGNHVVAVDPQSEGKLDVPQMTKDDRQMVTLWVLTPTPVTGTDSGPGISAARYQPASSSGSTRTVASARPPKPVRPAISALPHTASNMWLIALAALLSFAGGAAVLGFRRV